MRITVPDNLVQLGTVLDLTVEQDGKREKLTPRRGRQLLCSDASKETLWLLPKPKKKRTVRGPLPTNVAAALRRMAAVYRSWHDFEPRRTQVTPSMTVEGRWLALGQAVRIGYRSDKWDGRDHHYEHDFDRAQVLKLGPLYRITGGVRVTPRGIVG